MNTSEDFNQWRRGLGYPAPLPRQRAGVQLPGLGIVERRILTADTDELVISIEALELRIDQLMQGQGLKPARPSFDADPDPDHDY